MNQIVFIGMTKEDVLKYLAQNRIPYRIKKEDGIDFKMSRDYKENRVNLSVLCGIVSEYAYF